MEEQRKPRRWLTWLLIGLLVFVVYPMSYKPVQSLAVQSRWGIFCYINFIHWIYKPIRWVYHTGPQPLHDVLNWKFTPPPPAVPTSPATMTHEAHEPFSFERMGY